MTYRIYVSIMLLILAAQLLLSEQFVSMTWDEPQHIAAGYSKLVTHDFRMNTEHPPLLHFLEGLPLIFLKPRLPLEHESWNKKNMIEFTRQFFFVANNNPKQLLFAARIPVILLTVLLGLLVFLWTKDLFGKKSGLIALFLYAFEPTILAHGILATTDLGFAFFTFLALYCYWRFFIQPTKINLLFAGVTFGLVQLSKYTAVFLIPAYIIIIFVTCRKKKDLYFQGGSLLFIFFISAILVNIAYLGHGTAKTIFTSILNDPFIDTTRFNLETLFENESLTYFVAKYIPQPLPYYYLKGLGFVVNEGKNSGGKNLILGTWDEKGAWYYYFAAFVVKTTIALLFLTIIACSLSRSRRTEHWQFILIPFFVILIALSTANKQIGIRYVLALFPLLIVFIAGKITPVTNNKIFRYFIFTLFFAHAFSSLTAFPNYISYYNEFIGGTNGWKYFIDSNTDWGQDFDKLKHHVRCNPDTHISYFGTQDLAFYGLEQNKLEPPCKKGIWAISVSHTGQKEFIWLKKSMHFGQLGNSILLYNVTKCPPP